MTMHEFNAHPAGVLLPLPGFLIDLIRKLIKRTDMFNKSLKEEFEVLENKIKELESRLESKSEALNEANERYEKARTELIKTKKLVRSQTESDLLVNVFKAVGIIKDEKPVDYLAEANRLNVIRQQMSNQYGGGLFGGLFGGLCL